MEKLLSYTDKETTNKWATYDFLCNVNPDKKEVEVKLIINEMQPNGKHISTIQFGAKGSTIEEAKTNLAMKMCYLSMFALPADITTIASRDLLAIAV